MRQKLRTLKQAKKIVSELFKNHGNYIQFNIVDLAKISEPCVTEWLFSGDLEATEKCMLEMIERYRVN